MCGIPSLSPSTKLVLHVWNKNNVVPVIDDVFSIWEARSSFKDIFLPPKPGALCRYGNPFKSGTNAIVRYEVAIGNSTGDENFVPFTKVSLLQIILCIICINFNGCFYIQTHGYHIENEGVFCCDQVNKLKIHRPNYYTH